MLYQIGTFCFFTSSIPHSIALFAFWQRRCSDTYGIVVYHEHTKRHEINDPIHFFTKNDVAIPMGLWGIMSTRNSTRSMILKKTM